MRWNVSIGIQRRITWKKRESGRGKGKDNENGISKLLSCTRDTFKIVSTLVCGQTLSTAIGLDSATGTNGH